jgi:hypothetical protein
MTLNTKTMCTSLSQDHAQLLVFAPGSVMQIHISSHIQGD